MKNSEIERWVLAVVDQVRGGQPCEDSRVELKSAWPADHAKAARRIAGHANAARRERILWLIGVDESGTIIGADYDERTKWLPKVRANFSELVPDCQDLNVRTDGKTVVALVFETNRAPFVVKNPVFGQSGGGPVSLEVPWRDGTSTRSATRSDLMRILSDTTLLRALESELDWNLTVAATVGGVNQQRFRTTAFDRAMSDNALVDLATDLVTGIRDAYIEISNVESHVRSLEVAREGDGRAEASNRVLRSKREAHPRIQAALGNLRAFLGSS